MKYIVKLDEGQWRSRCYFGVTSFRERAAEFDSEKGAKISLSHLRRGNPHAYPDAKICGVTNVKYEQVYL